MKQRRIDHQTNAGAMADIAFLLLIFFMVVTTFNKAYELELKLPPKQENTRKGAISKQRLLTIYLNDQASILIGEKEYDENSPYSIVNEIKRITSQKKPGVIKVNMHPDTPYGTYLTFLSNLKRDKEILLNEIAMEIYQKLYNDLEKSQKQALLDKTKYSIIENEIAQL